MGKGDRKSRKGKIQTGSFGVRRPRKKHKTIVTKSTKLIAPEVKHIIKPETAVKTKVHPKEEIPVIIAETKHETIVETKVEAKAKVPSKAEPKAKVKEKAEPKAKAKEIKEPKAEPKKKKEK